MINRHAKSFPAVLSMLAIIVLGMIIYANSLYSAFQFDDYKFILKNPAVYHWYNFQQIWKFYPDRFIGTLSFAINYSFGGANPLGYHLVNLAIHLATAVLVWLLVTLTFLTPRLKSQPSTKNTQILATAIALLFLSHPLATSTINHITQRYTSLVAFFYLSALCCYIQGRLTEKRNYFTAAVIFSIAGMFTKQSAITLPFMFLMYEFYFFPKGEKGKSGRQIGSLLLLLILAAVFIFGIIHGHRVADLLSQRLDSQSHDGDLITATNYLLTQPRVIVTYIKLLFVPYPLNFDYDFPVTNSFWEYSTFLSALFLLDLLLIAALTFRKNILISFGIFWFFLTQVVESSILPIPYVIAEYRTYLPLVGFSIAFCAGLAALIKDRRRFLIILGLIVAVFSFMTVERNNVWQTEKNFWQDSLQKSPYKARPYFGLGVAYQRQGDRVTAIKYFQKALEFDPFYVDDYMNLSLCLGQLGRYEEALPYALRAYALNPLYPKNSHNLGLIYMRLGDFKKSFAYFQNLLNQDFNNENLAEYTKLLITYYQTTKDEKPVEPYIAFLQKFGLKEELSYIRQSLKNFR